MNPSLFQLLMNSEAIQIAPPDRPFWYTSGTIGPFYLNTHFLYGSRNKAESLLSFIDKNSQDRTFLLQELNRQTWKNYKEDETYRSVIDRLVAAIREKAGEGRFDYVSGGERRDWFFSVAAARRLRAEHLFIFKDRTMLKLKSNAQQPQAVEITALDGAKVLHIADLVTEASSYVRAWLPSIRERKGEMIAAFNIVDRSQGGTEALAKHNVEAHALIRIDPAFFRRLKSEGFIDEATANTLADFHRNPHASMKKLLENQPRIIARALEDEDAKTRARAQLLLRENPFGFDEEFLWQFPHPE